MENTTTAVEPDKNTYVVTSKSNGWIKLRIAAREIPPDRRTVTTLPDEQV